MTALNSYKEAFNSVGWFIPPYVQMGYLSSIVQGINNQSLDEKSLEPYLAQIYNPENMAAMVLERYPITPYVNEYKEIISESVKAHFLGLSHIAVSGLMPVIEGVGKKLAESRDVSYTDIKSVFTNLANDCKQEVVAKKLGQVDEVLAMLDAFINFTDENLYINSKRYPLSDNTNRHGILHGAFTDVNYGEAINFYKSIGAIDFLCFISAIRASISWFAPSITEESTKLALYYHLCTKLGKQQS